MTYLRRALIAIDRAWNSVLGGNRDGETISSAVGRKAAAGRRLFIALEAAIDLLFAVFAGQRHHCAENIEIGAKHER